MAVLSVYITGLFLSIIPIIIYAASPILVGFSANLNRPNNFVHLNPVTGIFTELAGANRWDVLDATYFAKADKFIAIANDYTVYNGSTGFIISSAPIRFPFGSNNAGFNVQIDQNTGAMYMYNLAGNKPGLYKVDFETGITTLLTLLTSIQSLSVGVSVYDSDAHLYVCFGNDAAGMQNMYVFNTTSPGAVNIIPISWTPDDFSFVLWQPSVKHTMIGYNSSNAQLVNIDIFTGVSTPVSGKRSNMEGISSQQAAALDLSTDSIYVVFVNFTASPSRYMVGTMNIISGVFDRFVPTEKNTDMAFMFML